MVFDIEFVDSQSGFIDGPTFFVDDIVKGIVDKNKLSDIISGTAQRRVGKNPLLQFVPLCIIIIEDFPCCPLEEYFWRKVEVGIRLDLLFIKNKIQRFDIRKPFICWKQRYIEV